EILSGIELRGQLVHRGGQLCPLGFQVGLEFGGRGRLLLLRVVLLRVIRAHRRNPSFSASTSALRLSPTVILRFDAVVMRDLPTSPRIATMRKIAPVVIRPASHGANASVRAR